MRHATIAVVATRLLRRARGGSSRQRRTGQRSWWDRCLGCRLPSRIQTASLLLWRGSSLDRGMGEEVCWFGPTSAKQGRDRTVFNEPRQSVLAPRDVASLLSLIVFLFVIFLKMAQVAHRAEEVQSPQISSNKNEKCVISSLVIPGISGPAYVVSECA